MSTNLYSYISLDKKLSWNIYGNSLYIRAVQNVLLSNVWDHPTDSVRSWTLKQIFEWSKSINQLIVNQRLQSHSGKTRLQSTLGYTTFDGLENLLYLLQCWLIKQKKKLLQFISIRVDGKSSTALENNCYVAIFKSNLTQLVFFYFNFNFFNLISFNFGY